MSTNDSKVRILAECAILIAVGTVLAQFKLFRMPNGGSVTAVSMLPFILISFRHGTNWGLLAGFANSLLQMLLGGVYAPPAGTATALVGAVLLDYILAFTLLGLADGFSHMLGEKKTWKNVTFGTFAVCFLRFLCSFVSGFLIWGSLTEDGFGAVTFSLIYNGSYMLPETIITVAVMAALYQKAPMLFRQQGVGKKGI
ncbi:MAG: energy-coupled thiamine transporter ThiT [Bacillota bacterium]|nr:energy-coupled thiamine transporter ThiT [Eubacteriales bacterium]MDI9492099.1 energy-coupled thiamine transporter ThiT [Bacillota bacterium]NLV70474.1 energy-coupled thiamine transporter ThiT [Clostridiales bacterium]MDD3537844.1 energy-coupled thiamine transporter ThiT [Eubacteriales bacterium]MDD4286423.1 energy-coupled thiamine transporter ThiT [Eubacteriales bacterium]